MVSLSLVKWCHNRFSNRDIPAIHHRLIVGSVPNSVECDKLAPTKVSQHEYSNSQRMRTVSLVEWCHNRLRLNNRDIAAIHHRLIVVSYQIVLEHVECD
jgi:hypothetical protein